MTAYPRTVCSMLHGGSGDDDGGGVETWCAVTLTEVINFGSRRHGIVATVGGGRASEGTRLRILIHGVDSPITYAT